jgi:DNA-binding NarL/FixJ family response regulator
LFIRVLLADDSRIMRDAIRSFLSGHSEIATDMHTKALAERFGAAALLDEIRLGDDFILNFKTIAQKFRSVAA